MKGSLLTIAKGAAMGIAEVIPGVSGGTIAFITGIYERLLNAIRAFNPKLLPLWKKDGLAAVWQKIDGAFLLKLLIGMAAGFTLGLFLITHLLENYPIHLWSFFFGLILASLFLVGRQVEKWNWQNILLFVIGTALVYWITIAAPSQGSDSPIAVFFAAMIAISALMLPGLSGSFILLLMGMYTIIMPAIKAFIKNPFGPETTTMFAFAFGALVGVFSFANLLSWLFKRYKNQTLALLTGFLLGSLNKVWPWQHVTETRVNSKEELVPYLTESVLPSTFAQLSPENLSYGNQPFTIYAIGIMILAALSVLAMDHFAADSK